MVRVVLDECLNRVATPQYLAARSRPYPLFCPLLPAQHRAAFLAFLPATGHPAVVRLVWQEGASLLGNDPAVVLQNVLDTDIEELKFLVRHVDTWGSYVGTLRGHLSPALAPPAGSRAVLGTWRQALTVDLTFWLQQNVPGYCLGTIQIDRTAQRILDTMERLLRATPSCYCYNQDLWLWAQPLLTRQLVKALIPGAQHGRPGLDLGQAQQWLNAKVPGVLEFLHQTFGIRDIDGDAVEAAVLLAVMSMDGAQYARVCGRPGGLNECLKALLLQELERQVRATFLPRPLSSCPGGGGAPKARAWEEAEVLLRRWWLDTYRRLADSGQNARSSTGSGTPGRGERKILKDELRAAVHNAPRGALPNGLTLRRAACQELDPRHMRTEPELRRLVRSQAVCLLSGVGMVPAALQWSPRLPAARDARFSRRRSVCLQRALVLWLRPAEGCIDSLPALAYLLDDLRGATVSVRDVVEVPLVIKQVVHNFCWHSCTTKAFLMGCRRDLRRARAATRRRRSETAAVSVSNSAPARRRTRSPLCSRRGSCGTLRPRGPSPPPSYDDVVAWVSATKIAGQPAAQVVRELQTGPGRAVSPPVSLVRANTTRARQRLIEEMLARVQESTAFWLDKG